MGWESLLGYEPAVRRLVRDTGDHDLARVQMVVDDEERDKNIIMEALRQTSEAGASLPPDLSLKICALLEAKNKKGKPPKTEVQKIRIQIFEEAYAETLGRINVRKVLDGDPNPKKRAGKELCRLPVGFLNLNVNSETFPKFCHRNRRAILYGEVCEIHKLLASGAITIGGDEFKSWVKSIQARNKAIVAPCIEGLELMFK